MILEQSSRAIRFAPFRLPTTQKCSRMAFKVMEEGQLAFHLDGSRAGT